MLGGENMTQVFYYDYVSIKPRTYFLTATEYGLTYVGLKDDDQTSPIFSFYPHVILVHDPIRLAPYAKELQEYFAGMRRKLDLPIDISKFGTEFQREALQVVQKVPYGTTVNSSQLLFPMPNLHAA